MDADPARLRAARVARHRLAGGARAVRTAADARRGDGHRGQAHGRRRQGAGGAHHGVPRPDRPRDRRARRRLARRRDHRGRRLRDVQHVGRRQGGARQRRPARDRSDRTQDAHRDRQGSGGSPDRSRLRADPPRARRAAAEGGPIPGRHRGGPRGDRGGARWEACATAPLSEATRAREPPGRGRDRERTRRIVDLPRGHHRADPRPDPRLRADPPQRPHGGPPRRPLQPLQGRALVMARGLAVFADRRHHPAVAVDVVLLGFVADGHLVLGRWRPFGWGGRATATERGG